MEDDDMIRRTTAKYVTNYSVVVEDARGLHSCEGELRRA